MRGEGGGGVMLAFLTIVLSFFSYYSITFTLVVDIFYRKG